MSKTHRGLLIALLNYSISKQKIESNLKGFELLLVKVFITNLRSEIKTTKKKNLNYANCVLRLSTGRADTIKSELPSDASSNSLKVTVFVPF